MFSPIYHLLSTLYQPVNLRGKNKIIIEKSADGMGPEFEPHPAPTELDDWVVPFSLGYFSDFIYEFEGLLEILEFKFPLDPFSLDDLPTAIYLFQVLFGLI